MSERYLVTGIQLGLLIATKSKQARKEIVDVIVDRQFIGNSDDIVTSDALKLSYHTDAIFFNKDKLIKQG